VVILSLSHNAYREYWLHHTVRLCPLWPPARRRRFAVALTRPRTTVVVAAIRRGPMERRKSCGCRGLHTGQRSHPGILAPRNHRGHFRYQRARPLPARQNIAAQTLAASQAARATSPGEPASPAVAAHARKPGRVVAPKLSAATVLPFSRALPNPARRAAG